MGIRSSVPPFHFQRSLFFLTLLFFSGLHSAVIIMSLLLPCMQILCKFVFQYPPSLLLLTFFSLKLFHWLRKRNKTNKKKLTLINEFICVGFQFTKFASALDSFKSLLFFFPFIIFHCVSCVTCSSPTYFVQKFDY